MLDTLSLFAGSITGALIVAAGCSVLGVFLVLRRIVFVGAALAQLSSAGVALAVLLQSLGFGAALVSDPLTLSFAVTLAGTTFFGLRASRGNVPQDAGLGVVFVVAGAIAVLFVARTAQADIYDLFFGGDVLLIPREEVMGLVAVIAPVLLVHYLLHKEFVFVSYDAEMAATLGLPVTWWNIALFATFGIVITMSIRTVGVLLAFAYLVLPAIIGLLVGHRLRGVFAAAIVSGLLGTIVGFAASVLLDLPSGATIIVALGLLLLVVWSVRRGRG